MRRATVLVSLVIFLSLLSSSSSFAVEDKNMYLYKELDLRLRIDNTVTVIPESEDFYIDIVAANLSWFPKDDYRQQKESFSTDPQARVGENVEFTWMQPSGLQFPLSLDSRILTRNRFVEIHKKVPFPIQGVSQDLAPFLKPHEITDTNKDIQRKAAQLAEGKDDLYDVAFTLADWVKENVHYNLSSTTANAVQKSSWVLKNREGVCDEITSLFISLCRSLGVPAKFVSGMAYTNLAELGMTYGPHGWAEVYFPGVGWVPFDVTYREMGYLDATHIKLQESSDAKSSSVEYLSRGRDISIKGGSLTINVGTLKKGVLVPPSIDLKAFVKEERIGIGSYNLITAEVENREDYYLTADLELAQTKELELIDGSYKVSAMLRPHETKTISWVVRVIENLPAGYTYTFPIEIVDIRGARATSGFTVRQDSVIHTYSEFKGAVIPEERLTSDLSCTTPREKYPFTAPIAISCDLANLEDFTKIYTVCIKDACEKKEVTAKKNTSFTLDLQDRKPGLNNIVITAQYKGESTRAYILLNFLVAPNISILNVTAPSTIGYTENGTVSFILTKNQESIAKNMRLSLTHRKLKKDWAVPNLDLSQEFRISFYGNNLYSGENVFILNASWQDDEGKRYETRQEFTTTLTHITFWQSIALFFDDVESAIFG